MYKEFAEIFAKQPDEITKGDYFYRIPWLDDIHAEAARKRACRSMGFLNGKTEKNIEFQAKMASEHTKPISSLSQIRGNNRQNRVG
jgi:hypothetical protein